MPKSVMTVIAPSQFRGANYAAYSRKRRTGVHVNNVSSRSRPPVSALVKSHHKLVKLLLVHTMIGLAVFD